MWCMYMLQAPGLLLIFYLSYSWHNNYMYNMHVVASIMCPYTLYLSLHVHVDRKNCENIHGKPTDMAYNAASFVWCPEIGAKVSLTLFLVIPHFELCCKISVCMYQSWFSLWGVVWVWLWPHLYLVILSIYMCMNCLRGILYNMYVCMCMYIYHVVSFPPISPCRLCFVSTASARNSPLRRG